jgi:hypothetical protein
MKGQTNPMAWVSMLILAMVVIVIGIMIVKNGLFQ